MSQASFINASSGGGIVTGIIGTANQVLANGTSGVLTVGNVTLTTPQDIATDSDVQFASVQVDDGSVGDPSYSFKDEPTLGIYRQPTESMVFVANGNPILGVSSGAIQPFVTCSLGAGLSLKYTATAVDFTATLYEDCIIGVTNTGAPRTITLPQLGEQGSLYVVTDESGGAATNNITVVGDGGTLINNAASFVININYGSATFYFNGTKYFVM